MTTSKEISILKLVIDLIKVDNKIHQEEISWIETLTTRYQFSDEELQQAHEISLSEAITTLQRLNVAERNEVLNLFKDIIAADNNIDINERILHTAIQLALQENTLDKTQILTVEAQNFDQYDRQLIYLEQKECRHAADCIAQDYNAIRRQLKSYDIDLFFYPHIAQKYTQSHSYIDPAINLLFPNFSHHDNRKVIGDCSTRDFCAYIHHLMGKDIELPPFDALFILKIQSNHCADKHTVDFLCMQCDRQPRHTIDTFMEYMDVELSQEAIPYLGCYRTFFEMLSEKSKCEYDILLEGDLYYITQGTQKLVLDIRGAERKTLFALFLLHKNGISNRTFTALSPQTALGKEIVTIYSYFAKEKNYETICNALEAGDEPAVICNLRDISKRNSHIGYIKRAFTNIPSIKSPQLYYPQNIKGARKYTIGLPDDKIKCKHLSSESIEPLHIEFFR